MIGARQPVGPAGARERRRADRAHPAGPPGARRRWCRACFCGGRSRPAPSNAALPAGPAVRAPPAAAAGAGGGARASLSRRARTRGAATSPSCWTCRRACRCARPTARASTWRDVARTRSSPRLPADAAVLLVGAADRPRVALRWSTDRARLAARLAALDGARHADRPRPGGAARARRSVAATGCAGGGGHRSAGDGNRSIRRRAARGRVAHRRPARRQRRHHGARRHRAAVRRGARRHGRRRAAQLRCGRTRRRRWRRGSTTSPGCGARWSSRRARPDACTWIRRHVPACCASRSTAVATRSPSTTRQSPGSRPSRRSTCCWSRSRMRWAPRCAPLVGAVPAARLEVVNAAGLRERAGLASVGGGHDLRSRRAVRRAARQRALPGAATRERRLSERPRGRRRRGRRLGRRPPGPRRAARARGRRSDPRRPAPAARRGGSRHDGGVAPRRLSLPDRGRARRAPRRLPGRRAAAAS